MKSSTFLAVLVWLAIGFILFYLMRATFCPSETCQEQAYQTQNSTVQQGSPCVPSCELAVLVLFMFIWVMGIVLYRRVYGRKESLGEVIR